MRTSFRTSRRHDMATVRLQNKDGTGILTYDAPEGDGPVEFAVDTKVEGIRNVVNRYFNRSRDYSIPESQEIDDYRQEEQVPTKDISYFELALMEFQAETDIQVFWPKDQKGLDQIVVTEEEA